METIEQVELKKWAVEAEGFEWDENLPLSHYSNRLGDFDILLYNLEKERDRIAREEEVISIKGFLMSFAGSQDFGKMMEAIEKRLEVLTTPNDKDHE